MRRAALIVLAVLTVLLASASVAQAVTVRYGPYTIPAGTSAADPGELNNRLSFAVRRPCTDCFITSFQPNLVDATTLQPVNMDTGPMLHHAVWTSQWRRDATCGGSWLGLAGERFFAAGNERTTISMPYGYGYRVRWYDSWNLLVDLMNHSTTEKKVYVEVNFSTRPSWASVKSVKPVWLDVDQCGDSEYEIPAGPSDKHWDWNVNVPGHVVSAAGHVHGHGVAVEATNESNGTSICRSTAKLDPMDAHNVMSMSTCVGNPSLGRVYSGQRVRLHSEYNATHPVPDVMGIMLAYIRPD